MKSIMPDSRDFLSTCRASIFIDLVLGDVEADPVNQEFPTAMTEGLFSFVSRDVTSVNIV